LAIELAFAKKNNDDLSVQVKEGFQTKRAHGQYPGPAPTGYLNSIIRPGERNIIPDPQKAPKVITLFEMASTGTYTLHDLWLEAQNLSLLSRQGHTLGKQTLVELLKRRVYAGFFQYGDTEWHVGSYESLITMDLFDKTQLAMGWVKHKSIDRPSTTSGRHYPFKGLFLCEYCKFNITAYTKSKKLASGDIAEYVFYTCTKKNTKIVCEEAQISSQVIEAEITARMHEFELSDKNAKECLTWLERFHRDYMHQKNQYRPVWLDEQRNAKKALDTLDEKLEQGVIADERYKARAATHQETLARTTAQLGKSDTDANRWLELAKETFTSAVDLGEVFSVANNDERRRMMMLVGSNWYLGNKKVELTPRRPFDLLRHSSDNMLWRTRPDLNRRSPP
jgi:site-specific DNA recombinase